MPRKHIKKSLKELVVNRARNRCEYCQTQAIFTAVRLEVDHILPIALQGVDDETNLCLACPYCNGSKNDQITGFDTQSGEEVNLFNPRTENWEEHFNWSRNGEKILGTSKTGRATVTTLKLNRVELVRARKVWVEVGWHPPKD